MDKFKKELSWYNLIIKYEIGALHTFLRTLKGQVHDFMDSKGVLFGMNTLSANGHPEEEKVDVFVDTKSCPT